MDYPRLKALLSDDDYIRRLLSDGVLCDECGMNSTIPEGWIDQAESEKITAHYKLLTEQDGTFLNVIKVVRNPEIPPDTVAVENIEDRRRFVLITVVPDVDAAYALNLPTFQTVGYLALYGWDLSRATTRAAKYAGEVKFATKPLPPVLNNAYVDWVTIYVGKNDFQGRRNIGATYVEGENDLLDMDIHLYEARKMEEKPLMQKLVEAYDADCVDAQD